MSIEVLIQEDNPSKVEKLTQGTVLTKKVCHSKWSHGWGMHDKLMYDSVQWFISIYFEVCLGMHLNVENKSVSGEVFPKHSFAASSFSQLNEFLFFINIFFWI